MKNPDKDKIVKLEELPNIGKSIASHLRQIGINKPKELIGKNPFDLHQKLCKKVKKKVDPCVIDVFMSAIDFMEGGKAKPWWNFTKKRKEILGVLNSI